MAEDKIYMFGRNVVKEAIEHRPETVLEVFIIEESKDALLKDLVEKADIKTSLLNPKALPGRLEKSVNHQGVVALVDSDKLTIPYKHFISELEISNETSLLIFGEVQDPQNVGAAIRSATAFGISAVLIPPHNQAPVNGTVIKVSAGTIFRIPLVSISNVNATIRDLKSKGFWAYGLDGRGETKLTEEQFNKPSLFVLGNEGEGLRKMTMEACDTILSIPIQDRCESMNASASVAVVFYEWSKQHPESIAK